MKRKMMHLLMLASVLTTLGFLADGDVKEPNMLIRFMEYAFMMGIVFVCISFLYFPYTWIKQVARK